LKKPFSHGSPSLGHTIEGGLFGGYRKSFNGVLRTCLGGDFFGSAWASTREKKVREDLHFRFFDRGVASRGGRSSTNQRLLRNAGGGLIRESVDSTVPFPKWGRSQNQSMETSRTPPVIWSVRTTAGRRPVALVQFCNFCFLTSKTGYVLEKERSRRISLIRCWKLRTCYLQKEEMENREDKTN